MSFRDLAVKAYETGGAKVEERQCRKLRRDFVDTFGIKPERIELSPLAAHIGPYTFERSEDPVYVFSKNWWLIITCPRCHKASMSHRANNLSEVGKRILAWERDHKCNVTTTGEG